MVAGIVSRGQPHFSDPFLRGAKATSMRGPHNRGATEDAEALHSARALLEVSADADVAELARAYWRQARRMHPDLSTDPQATQQFQALNDAYRLILDAAPAAIRSPTQPSHESHEHGDPTEPKEPTEPMRAAGRPGMTVGTTRVDRNPSSRGWTIPTTPGLNEGVWVVAGPVHVLPPPRPDTAKNPQEGRP